MLILVLFKVVNERAQREQFFKYPADEPEARGLCAGLDFNVHHTEAICRIHGEKLRACFFSQRLVMVVLNHTYDGVGLITKGVDLLPNGVLPTGFFDKRTQELHTEELNLNQELTKEKSTLERRVRSHTKEIEHLQLEQAEQLYRFAEIGQLSTLLLHDLSNHLTVLNIDLADLKREKGTTPAHIEESINHLEDSVKQASRHLQGKEQMHEFDVLKCIESSTKLPHYQDLKECISISAPPHRVHLYGDPLRLSHILFILIRNALESYPRNTPSRERTVTIELETNEDTISISVTDQGRGVPEAIRDQLFSPMISTKKGGLGIGLFIAKEITESYFGGMLQLGDVTKGTKFILTIPKQPTRHGAE